MDAKTRAAAICADAQTAEERQAAIEMLCDEIQSLKPAPMLPETESMVRVEYSEAVFFSEYDASGNGVRVCIDTRTGPMDIGDLLDRRSLNDIDEKAHKLLRKRDREAA